MRLQKRLRNRQKRKIILGSNIYRCHPELVSESQRDSFSKFYEKLKLVQFDKAIKN